MHNKQVSGWEELPKHINGEKIIKENTVFLSLQN